MHQLAYGPTGPMGLQDLWAYRTYGPTGPMGLQDLWAYRTYGPTGPMGLQDLWAYRTYGPTGRSAGVAEREQALPVGIIGCGTMGSSHARQMAALAEIRLAAACDVDQARVRAAAAAAGGDVRVYTEVDRLPEQADIPAVIVATPNFTHKELVLRALAAGKEVFCE